MTEKAKHSEVVAMLEPEKAQGSQNLDREQVFNGVSGLLSTLFLASTIVLFSFLQLMSSGDFKQWVESDCRVGSSAQTFFTILIPAIQINIIVIHLCCSVLLVQMVFQIGGLKITYWHRQHVVNVSGVLYIMFTVLLCLMSYLIYIFSLTKFPNQFNPDTCPDIQTNSETGSFWNLTVSGGSYATVGYFWWSVGFILVIFMWASCVVGPNQFKFAGDGV